MKKLLITLIISLNLSMPAHAFLASIPAAIVSGPVAIIMITSGTLNVIASEVKDESAYRDLAVLFEAEKNSENSLVSVNVLDDIEALISVNIYNETQGDILRSEWKSFESEKESIFINAEQIQGMSPDKVVDKIQSETGFSKLLAEYFAYKIGVQVQ